MAATLGPAVAGGHLRLWSPEADAQALFERIGADGTLGLPTDGTRLHPARHAERQREQDRLVPAPRRHLRAHRRPRHGAIAATVTVTLTNTAPTSGVSAYILGEQNGPTKVGENDVRLTVVSPHRLITVTDAAGEELPVNVGREKGLYAITVSVDLDSGTSETVEFTVAGLLTPTDGDYRLHVRRQPAVVPDEVAVTVHGGRGWEPTTEEIDPATLDGRSRRHRQGALRARRLTVERALRRRRAHGGRDGDQADGRRGVERALGAAVGEGHRGRSG